MFGNSITLNVGTIADPVEVILPRINQDGYSSEYQLKDTDRTHQVLIRHTSEKNKVNGETMDRHNVTVRQIILPTELLPQGSLREAYLVLRMSKSAVLDDIVQPLQGLLNFAVVPATQASIVNWES